MTDTSLETNTPLDELGPVDYVVVEFPAGASNFTGEMAAELVALVDAGPPRSTAFGSISQRRVFPAQARVVLPQVLPV